LRVLDPDLLHVTLHFLGSRPLEQIDLLAARLAACTGTVGELSVGAPLWLPPRRPRALAVELYDQSGGLARVQAAVVAELGHADPGQTGAASRGRPAEGARRHFRPHVTVARMGHGYAPRERLLPPTPALSFVPGELILYRSWLSPEGASYEPLASCAIG
jgi:2'-5' RNA ligase